MNQLEEIKPFYTSIYTTQLEIDNLNLKNFILDLKSKHDSVIMSNVGGWQSKNYLLVEETKNNCVYDLIDKTTFHIKEIYKTLKVDSVGNLENYWFNVNKRYDYNLAHSHSMCYFSAVYYVKCPSNSGNLHFERPDLFRETIPFYDLIENNWGEYWIKPKAGKLIIFPSFLRHYVSQNLTEDVDSDRISIALNFK
jgi:uncharacterized protein (TIGR02466 family)